MRFKAQSCDGFSNFFIKKPGISLRPTSTVQCRITDLFPEFFFYPPHSKHLNPAKLKAFIRLDSMTDELVFPVELILKIKQKQGPAEACKKPLCCRVSSLSESEINLVVLNIHFHAYYLVLTVLGSYVCLFFWCWRNSVCSLLHVILNLHLIISHHVFVRLISQFPSCTDKKICPTILLYMEISPLPPCPYIAVCLVCLYATTVWSFVMMTASACHRSPSSPQSCCCRLCP